MTPETARRELDLLIRRRKFDMQQSAKVYQATLTSIQQTFERRALKLAKVINGGIAVGAPSDIPPLVDEAMIGIEQDLTNA